MRWRDEPRAIKIDRWERRIGTWDCLRVCEYANERPSDTTTITNANTNTTTTIATIAITAAVHYERWWHKAWIGGVG